MPGYILRATFVPKKDKAPRFDADLKRLQKALHDQAAKVQIANSQLHVKLNTDCADEEAVLDNLMNTMDREGLSDDWIIVCGWTFGPDPIQVPSRELCSFIFLIATPWVLWTHMTLTES
ncbi:hypothetical protein F53441_9435 [Fusarium austroafricanum]|uniref:Uncharacterized protein n=1 Tax=Fusarium austroafricanum TaxID=2364996 RepID=A0A8H4KDE6_9HYPO|nr:hypothetical protein F53441_9435 [Fusarium austroafricanum]